MMKGKVIWVSAATLLPAEGEEVLVKRNDEISLAVFSKKKFRLKEGGMISWTHKNLVWTPVAPHDSL